MRRASLLCAVAASFLLAACGGTQEVSAPPDSVQPATPEGETPDVSESPDGDASSTELAPRSITEIPQEVESLLPDNLLGLSNTGEVPPLACFGDPPDEAGAIYRTRGTELWLYICRHDSPTTADNAIDEVIRNFQADGFQLVAQPQPIVDQSGTPLGHGAYLTNPSTTDVVVETLQWSNSAMTGSLFAVDSTPPGAAEDFFNELGF